MQCDSFVTYQKVETPLQNLVFLEGKDKQDYDNREGIK